MVNALDTKIDGITFLFIIFLTSKDYENLRSDHRYSRVERWYISPRFAYFT